MKEYIIPCVELRVVNFIPSLRGVDVYLKLFFSDPENKPFEPYAPYIARWKVTIDGSWMKKGKGYISKDIIEKADLKFILKENVWWKNYILYTSTDHHDMPTEESMNLYEACCKHKDTLNFYSIEASFLEDYFPKTDNTFIGQKKLPECPVVSLW